MEKEIMSVVLSIGGIMMTILGIVNLKNEIIEGSKYGLFFCAGIFFATAIFTFLKNKKKE